MYKLPSNTIPKQGNVGDRLSDLWASFNLDLTSNLGIIKPSPRMVLNRSEADDAQMDAPPCAFRFFKAGSKFIWTVAGGYVWSSAGGPETSFAQDETAGTPTNCNSDQSDLELMGGVMYVSEASDDIYKLAADGTWSKLTNALMNSSGLHQMVYSRTTNKLYIVDDNSASVGSFDADGTTYNTPTSAGTVSYTLNDLCAGIGGSTGSFISWINATSDYIWIGTISIDGTQGEVYAWNGVTSNSVSKVYTLDSNGSLACIIKDDVPVIMDVKGRLLQLNGGTFVELARLPFENKPPRNYTGNATSRLVHYNGMGLVDGKINILVNATLHDTNSTNKENVPSGIWEYTPETGLYHKASVGLTKADGTITDYGGQKLAAVGAFQEIDCPSTITQGSINGRFLVGCDYYTDATTSKSAVFYDDTNNTLQTACSFTTAKIFASSVSDIFQKLYVRCKKLVTSTDKIVFKYRVAEEDSSEMTITWASTTSFTTSTSLIGKKGYEIEILSGVGAGRCAHLATCGYNGSNYIATTDETITGATGTSKARVQNWKKLGTLDDQNSNFVELPIDDMSTWVQIKVWFLSTGKNEIHDLLLVNAPQQKAI